jgi:hypothetical protein
VSQMGEVEEGQGGGVLFIGRGSVKESCNSHFLHHKTVPS